MNAPRSSGVDTMAPDAHAPLGLSAVVTSCGGCPGGTTYPRICGAGSEMRRVGNVVCLSPARAKTSRERRRPYDRPVTRSAIRPTTMLSVLEYSYFEPGGNASPSDRTQSMIPDGRTYLRGSRSACLANSSDRV